MPVDHTLRGGLFKSIVMGPNDVDVVCDSRKWDQLAETAEPVGECRGMVAVEHEGRKVFVPCDGVLLALPTPDYQDPEDAVWWQEAQCPNCRYEVALPNRRKLVRSTRHSEMPQNYWQDRMRRLKPADAPA